MQKALIGIIGGSGLYQMTALQQPTEHLIDTPYGKPSDAIVSGFVHDVPVAFLARHGRGHRLIPSEMPYRANIHAMKQMGVRYLISMSAVGSLREEIKPLDMVLPTQFIDLTHQRNSSFFGNGAVAHVSMAQPICQNLADVLARAMSETRQDEQINLYRAAVTFALKAPSFQPWQNLSGIAACAPALSA
jgi:5'-methylthioadenosine phosphorylase